MEEPENIFIHLHQFFGEETSEERAASPVNSHPSLLTLKGKKVLITAGPTHENIDPVRFISNRSTGKMGFAIARELAVQGAEVTLITGPSSQKIDSDTNKVHRIDVESAQEMYDECMKNSGDKD